MTNNALTTANALNSGSTTIPQSSGQGDGCGTSFTEATDKKNIHVKHTLGSVEAHSRNENGDVEKVCYLPSGTSHTMAADGSHIFTTSVREGDPNTGRFDVNAQGACRIKVGESLLIEVSDKNHITAGTDGDSSTAKAMSVVVYGNIDITSMGGEINAQAKSIQLVAHDELVLKAGSKISLLSGEGKGQNQSSTTSSGATEGAKKDYGGVVEIKAGDFTTDIQTRRETSAVNYTLASHESAHIATETLANHGFQSPGSFTMDIQGDLYEKIAGKRRTDIFGTGTPINSIFQGGQPQSWLVTVTGSAAEAGASTPNAFEVSATTGGFQFYTNEGDIDIYTKSGYWGVGNSTKVVAGVDKPVVGYPNVKKGLYLLTLEDTAYLSSTTEVQIYSNSVETAGIKISTAKIEIKNPTGIYLN